MQAELLDSIVSSNSQELPNASSALKLFENPQFRVRVVMRDGEPWFVAKDVCDCLELGNVSQTCSRLDDDERGIILNDTPLASKKCLSYQSPVCTVLSVRLKNKKQKRLNGGSITKSYRPSAKQIEEWSEMSKMTLWRWLEKLEKAHRISRCFRYETPWM